VWLLSADLRSGVGKMLARHQFELTLMLLAATFVYLTYSPADSTHFWMYWVRLLLSPASPLNYE
jgi:hypothetical protein